MLLSGQSSEAGDNQASREEHGGASGKRTAKHDGGARESHPDKSPTGRKGGEEPIG